MPNEQLATLQERTVGTMLLELINDPGEQDWSIDAAFERMRSTQPQCPTRCQLLADAIVDMNQLAYQDVRFNAWDRLEDVTVVQFVQEHQSKSILEKHAASKRGAPH